MKTTEYNELNKKLKKVIKGEISGVFATEDMCFIHGDLVTELALLASAVQKILKKMPKSLAESAKEGFIACLEDESEAEKPKKRGRKAKTNE